MSLDSYLSASFVELCFNDKCNCLIITIDIIPIIAQAALRLSLSRRDASKTSLREERSCRGEEKVRQSDDESCPVMIIMAMLIVDEKIDGGKMAAKP